MDARLTADEDRPPYVHLSWAEGRRPRPNVNAHRHVSPMTDGAWHGLLGPCCGIGHRRRRDARTGATIGKAETLRRRGRPHTSTCDRDRYPTGQDPRHRYLSGIIRACAPIPLPHTIGLLPLVPHPMPMLPPPHPLGVTGPIAGQHSSFSARGDPPFWGPGALRSACIVDFIDSFAPKTVRGPSPENLGRKTQKTKQNKQTPPNKITK